MAKTTKPPAKEKAKEKDDEHTKQCAHARAYALAPPTKKTFAEHTLQFAYPTAKQPRPRQDKGALIPRARGNIQSSNGITETEREFVRQYLNNLDKKKQLSLHQVLNRVLGKKGIDTAEISMYVKSFQYTFLAERKYKSNCITIHSSTADSTPFSKHNDTVQTFWKNNKKSHCHIPVLVGKTKTSHLFGISVDKNKKKIFVYDSKSRKTRKATDEPNIVIQLSDNDYKQKISLNNVSGPEVIKMICEEVLSIELDKYAELKWNQSKVKEMWKLHIINDFFQQQNHIDCGIFVCYFFECISRGINLVVKRKGEDNISMDLKQYREWVAYSLVILDMYQKNEKKGVPKSESDEHVIDLL